MSEGHRALMQLNALNMAQLASIRGTQTALQGQGCSPSLALPVWCHLSTAGDGGWVGDTVTSTQQGDTVDHNWSKKEGIWL